MSTRTLAIGDIHGCRDQLAALVAALELSSRDHLILLGDYVDRGTDVAGVIEFILGLFQSCHVSAIKGNHEELMLAARNSRGEYLEWLASGGVATLRSYRSEALTLDAVPPSHWCFLESLKDYVETPSHIFVHACVDHDIPMHEQSADALRWRRFPSLLPHDSGKVVVCGHTPQKSGEPCNKGYAVCIDTNACRGGPLTCLHVETGEIWQADQYGDVSRGWLPEAEQ